MPETVHFSEQNMDYYLALLFQNEISIVLGEFS